MIHMNVCVSEYPEVVSVFPNRGRKLQTTRSWQFMRLERDGDVPPWSAWETARYGEDTIIGNLDSGVWPESKSSARAKWGRSRTTGRASARTSTTPTSIATGRFS